MGEGEGALVSLGSGMYGLAKAAALAVVVALLVRIFLFQPFTIPSGSMKPTLLVGDYLLISKYSYGYSRFSLPFAPKLFSGRFFFSSPRRGDVVVFRYGETNYIKRLVGLPGDRVQMKGGHLYINERMVSWRLAEPFVDDALPGHVVRVRRYRETMPGGPSYEVLDLHEGPGDDTSVYIVPKGHYFMMGDNRDNSSDSRLFSPVGFVPEENLVGRALFVYFSIGRARRGAGFMERLGLVRWGRLFSRVR